MHIYLDIPLPHGSCWQEVLLSVVLVRQEVSDWCRNNISWYFVAECDTDR